MKQIDTTSAYPYHKGQNNQRAIRPLICIILCFSITSCEEPDMFLERKGNNYIQTYQWEYDGHHFVMSLEIPMSTYHYYHGLPKSQPYVNFADEVAGYRYQKYVVQKLLDMVASYQYTERQKAEYLLTFVQSIGYTRDPVGPTDYPRYLIEVLVEKRQDCEDASCAVISLWRAAGFHTAFIDIPKQNHMAAGICIGGSCDSYYVGESGRRYVFAECTSLWPLGQNPFPDDSVIMFEVAPLYKCINSPYQKAHKSKVVSGKRF